MELEAQKERMEQEFQKLLNEKRNIEIELYRYQGEYRFLNRLLEECLSERAGLPPFNPLAGSEMTQSEVNTEVKNGT